jgi:hypothetical protein
MTVESDETLATAEQAGTDYANAQVDGEYFRDWVAEQLAEAERMRRADPNSVIPIDSPRAAREVAKNMLQQLKWDTHRDMDTDVILELSGAEGLTRSEIVRAFYRGFDAALQEPAIRNWLADLVLEIHESLTSGEPVVSESGSSEQHFTTLRAFLEHAKSDGATHVIVNTIGDAWVYFPLDGGQYDEWYVPKKNGRWSVSLRDVIDHFPRGAHPIDDYLSRDEVRKSSDRKTRKIHASRRRRPPPDYQGSSTAHTYNIEVFYRSEQSARKFEREVGRIIGQPLVSQGPMRDGYRMEYGPIDRIDFRRLEGAIYQEVGNAGNVHLVQVMYGADRALAERVSESPVTFQSGERLRIRSKGPGGQPFESFWFTVPSPMTLDEVALQFAQTGQPGMFLEIGSGKLQWTFRLGRHAGQPSVTRVCPAPPRART